MGWAFSFAAVDLFWVLGLHVVSWSRAKETVVPLGTWWSIADSATQLWNAIHLPIRWLIEPILFPIVTSHLQPPDEMVFFAYETLCVLQSALAGYAMCILVRWVMKQNRKPCDS
jgi:hypothetical protein